MMLACAVTSGEPLRPADIRSFPGVAFQAGPDNGDGGELRRTERYLTQPALMANLESPSRRLVLRTTLNFEGVTLGSGELTYGVWGEGFIDKRHPHTLLHEAMLSWNLWEIAGGGLSPASPTPGRAG